MTGSLEDADDLVQETFLRALDALAGFRGEASPRTWLYRIATNACLDHLRKRRRRELPEQASEAWDVREPIPARAAEDRWLQPFPTAPPFADGQSWAGDTPENRSLRREAISFAFLTALQILPPRQRAVLVLRDVLDFGSAEVATLIGSSVPAVKSALHRARATVAAHAPAEPARAPTAGATKELLGRYLRAWEQDDVEGLVALLKQDAVLAMPPYPSWYRGRDAVVALFRLHPFGSGRRAGWRLLATSANGDPAFGLYRADAPGGPYRPFGILALALEGAAEARVARITIFGNPGLLRRFGLPAELA